MSEAAAERPSERQGAQKTIEEGKDLASFLQYFIVSSDNVNFSFLSWVYLIMSFISMAMFVLEQYYDVQSIRGYYLVLMPFVPFAIWALVMHLVVLARQLVDPNLGQEQKEAKKKN
jgi:hypothetical protein